MAESFPFEAMATMKYKSAPGTPSPISFAKGDKLKVLSVDEDGDWYEGETQDGTKGFFPSGFVTKVEQEQEAEGNSIADQRQEAPAEPEIETQADEPVVSAIPAPLPPVVTEPIRKRSLPTPSSPTSASSASSTPELPAKSTSLKDRIAALNAQGAGAAPPPIRAKPREFKRAPLPTPAVVEQPKSPVSSPPVAVSILPPIAASAAEVERGTNPSAGLSAEDALESIGKGGGSLKDRIKALQGIQLDTPAPPGRAPKPWKKKSVEVPAEEGADESKVMDVQEGGDATEADVPGPTPAEPEVEDEERPKAEPFVAKPLAEDEPIVATSLDKVDESSSSRQDEAESVKSPIDPSPAPSQEVKTESRNAEAEDDEATKRAAIAERMAGLGGQKVGMAMPALPKRAGPPRRKAQPQAAQPAAPSTETPTTPAAESAPAAVEPEIKSLDEIKADEQEAIKADELAPVHPVVARAITDEPSAPAGARLVPKDEVELKKEAESNDDSESASVTAPVMLLGSSLLARSTLEDQGEEGNRRADDGDDDDDDFDTPSLPPASSRAVPAPIAPTPLSQEVVPDHEDEDEVLVGDDDAAEPEHSLEEEDEPVQSLSAVAPPPLPAGRPPIPPPTRPVVPPPIDTDVEETLTKDLAETQEESTPVPTAPATATRPAIPAIPASFAAASASEQPAPSAMRGSQARDDDSGIAVSPRIHSSRPAVPVAFASSAAQDDEEEEAPASPPARSIPLPIPVLPIQMGRPSIPPPLPPTATLSASQQAEKGGDDSEYEEVTDSEDDGEEEDPEVARRAALAARMAKLSGGARMGMGMGMMVPPIGAAPVAPKVKKMKRVKKVKEPTGDGDPDATEMTAATSEPLGEEERDDPPMSPAGVPRGGIALPGIVPRVPSHAAQSEAEDKPESTSSTPYEPTGAAAEEDVAPPPLPSGRPPSMPPPRRSIPDPVTSVDEDDAEVAAGGIARDSPAEPSRAYVDEPEPYDESRGGEEATPPPPPRPQGGLPPIPGVVRSPSLSSQTSPPTSPPLRQGSIKRDSIHSLERSGTRTSIDSRSGAGLGRGPSLDYQRDMAMVPESSQPSGASFTKSQLQESSMTLGAQVFAAAHFKLSDKSSRMSGGDTEFVDFCFERARGAQRMSNGAFGAVIWTLESTGKAAKGGPGAYELDEPRAGDIIVFIDCKFKATLSTTKVGADGRPKLAVVAAWDSKKRKLKTIEVAREGGVEEGSYKMDDFKEGRVEVQRVVAGTAEQA